MTVRLRLGIPDFLTLINLSLGLGSIINVLNGNLKTAATLIALAVVVDVLDGVSARIMKRVSRFGAELDSLSDIVSFGVAPSILMYTLVHSGIVFLIPLCGAIRLARFNMAERHIGFEGLPITASGGLIASLFFLDTTMSTHFLYGLLITLSVLMISTIPYPSYKEANLRKPALPLSILVVSAIPMIFDIKFLILPFMVYTLTGAMSCIVRICVPKRRNEPYQKG